MNSSPSEPTASLSLRAMAGRGLSWMAVQTVGTRLLSLLGQFILGWLLNPTDFGLYALALSIASAVGAVRNGGVTQLLSRHSKDFDAQARSLGGFALIFNLAAAVLLCLLAPLAAAHFHTRELIGLLLCIAISFPLGTRAMIYRSRLAVDGRYRELTLLTCVSTVFWQAATIGMALAGCGPFSYVVPTLLQGPFETGLGFYLLRRWPRIEPRLGRPAFAAIFRDTAWVMLGAAMLSLATTGDYLAVGLFTTAALVGQYFFAFQLVSAAGTLLSSGIESVLPPLLARLEFNRPKQSEALLEMTQLLMTLSWPLAGAVAFAAPPLIEWVWGSKWAPAGQALHIMAFCLPAWILKAAVRALMEARGVWRQRFLLLGAYGVGAIACAAAGASTGKLEIIATTMTAYYLLFAVLLLPVLSRLTAISSMSIARRLMLPCCICLVSSIIAEWAAFGLSSRVPPQLAAWTSPACYLAATLILNAVGLRREWLAILIWRPVLARSA